MLDEFLLKRKCNASNVFIFETSDPRRIQQFINFVSEIFKNHRILIYDLQTQSITDASGAPVSTGEGYFGIVSVQQLLELLRSKPTMLIIRYVCDRRHAEAISDFLIAASHNDSLYRNTSTVAVFADDQEFFVSGVLRLVCTIDVVPSTAEERRKLLEGIANQIKAGLAEKFGSDVDVDLTVTDDVVQASSGLTLHETESAALESFFRERKFSTPIFTEYKISILKKKLSLEYIKPTRGFESVGGYDYVKDYIKRRVIMPLRNPEIVVKYGLSVPKGFLLYGPPGCGKTWICKALAAEIGLPMISLKASDLLRGIVGETETRVRQLTRIVESLAPVVLFIDEFDQLTLSRQTTAITDSGVTRRMTNMLLEWLGSEDRRTFVVGATNFVEDIDPAFLRPGRLDAVIPVLFPDIKARYEILKIHVGVIKKKPLKNENILKDVAEKTFMYSGADIEKLVDEASYLAAEERAEFIVEDHFIEAMNSIEVNVEERLNLVRNMVNNMRKIENLNKRLLKAALESLKSYESEKDIRIKSLISSL